MNESKSFLCHTSKLILREGDILDTKSEVIVSSDNVGLQMASGVSRAIHTQGGEAIDIDLDKVDHAELGDVVVTSAGKLKQRYVFHCVADKRRSSRNADIIPVVINRTVFRCLQLLPMLGVYSIAFPAIGTGAVGLPTKAVAQSMLDVIASHLMQTSQSLTIEIYAWGEENYTEWLERMEENENFSCVEDADEKTPDKKEDHYDVFISYSWKNQDFALELDKWLTENGVSHFLDRNCIMGGQDHKEVIIGKLKKAKLVLFLSSEDSNASELVKGEICNAINYRIPIIPLRLDMTSFRDTFMYDLVNVLWIDMTQGLESKKDELMKYIRSYDIGNGGA